MSRDAAGLFCDGCKTGIPHDALDSVAYNPGPRKDLQHYHQACWQTGWYTGIDPKGEWPIDPTDPTDLRVPSFERVTHIDFEGGEPAFDHIKDDPWADRPGYGAGDPVNSPAHYRWLPNGVEVIDITETLGFCLGNVVKYTLRADHKGKPLEDLRKARWYLDREIANRESRDVV